MFLVLVAVGALYALGRSGSSKSEWIEVVPEPSSDNEDDLHPARPTPEESQLETGDALWGRTRRQQLAQLGASSGANVVSDHEREVNRHLGASSATLGLVLVGTVYPPALILALGTALYSTMYILRQGYDAIVKEHKLRISVVASLYFIGEFAGGFFIAGAFGLVIYCISEKLVLLTQDRSHKRMINIFGQQPRTVWLLVNGVEVEVPIESVESGDTVVVQAGQVVPVDGVIVQGIATIDQHVLTGESQPAEKGVGDRVLRATLMIGGKIYVRVEETGEETVAAQIGVMLNNTASYQAAIVSRGDEVADQSVLPTLSLAVVALGVSGYEYLVTVLGSGIGLNMRFTAPIAMLNFLNIGATNGILVKDGRSLELLSKVDTLVFDKTGTLTLDQPVITHIHTCADVDGNTVLMYAAAAEHRQTHPIARAILAEADRRGLAVPEIDRARYEMGYGLRVRWEEQFIRVGSERFMASEDIELPDTMQALVHAGQQQGHSLVMVAVDDRLVGALELEPTLRREAMGVVQQLRGRNLDIWIISGDQEAPTLEMAHSLGIENYFANISPGDKANLIAKLQSEGRSVCFVGDGINDSVALKKANVSISLRGASTAATDAAQIVLMGEGLKQLVLVFELADEFDLNMRAGFAVAVGQGVVVIGGALLGIIGIAWGKLIWVAGLAVGLAIAELPRVTHRGTIDDRTIDGSVPMLKDAGDLR